MKKRLDQILTERGYYASREKAQRAILAGLIFIDGNCADKPGIKYDEEIKIEVKGCDCPYVSRGGLKLAKALEVFRLDAAAKTVLDIGASTGGFTDCLLKHGAKKVYAVDVGYGQLHWSLRNDPRVVVVEKTNARFLNKEIIPETVDLAAIDVSFISLTKIIPAVLKLLHNEGDIITLIKPQFEAGKKMVKKGVVKEPEVHIQVLHKIISVVQELGWYLQGLDYSPLLGPEGNREFLGWWRKEKKELDLAQLVADVVNSAHRELITS